MSSIPGSVGYISHVHRAYDINWVPSGFSGYIWLTLTHWAKQSMFQPVAYLGFQKGGQMFAVH